MKVSFKKIISAPLWWEVEVSHVAYTRRYDADLDPAEIISLIDLLVEQFPSVRYKLWSELNYSSYIDKESKERVTKYHKGNLRFNVCFGSKADLAYFIVWANDGIEI